MRPPHFRHRVMSMAKTRARSFAHAMRRGRGEEMGEEAGESSGRAKSSASWRRRRYGGLGDDVLAQAVVAGEPMGVAQAARARPSIVAMFCGRPTTSVGETAIAGPSTIVVPSSGEEIYHRHLMDWRRRPFRSTKKPQSPASPQAVHADACARLRAAATPSASALVRESLAASIAAVHRTLASTEMLDPATKGGLKEALSALRWMQAAHRFASGEMTAREAIRSLMGDTARRSRLDLAENIRLAVEMRSTASSLVRGRNDGVAANLAAVGEARALTLIRALVPDGESPAAAEAERHFLSSDDVEEFAAATLFIDEESRLAWEVVENGIISATDPVVGFTLASILCHRAPSPPETDGHSCDGFLRIVQRGMRRMMRPELPEAYRRMVAHGLYAATSIVLDSQDDHEYQTGQSVSPKQRLYWTDLHMATSYRADSVFFGQGRVDVAGDESRDEGAWRAAIFRRREVMDDAIWLDACNVTLAQERHLLRRHGQEAVISRLADSLTASTRGTAPEDVVPMVEEIHQRAESGRANGWIAPPFALVNSADELERWVASMPGVGVLSSTGVGYWHVTFASQAGELVETLLIDRVALPDEEDEEMPEPGDHGGPAIEELDYLTSQLAEAIAGDGSYDGKTVSVDGALSSLFANHATAKLGAEIAAIVRRHGLSTLLVLASPEERVLPWEGLVVDDTGTTLAELVSIVRMYTLLPCATRDASIRAGMLQCVRAEDPANGSLLQSAWGLNEAVDAATTSTEEFVRACQTHGVLRLLIHASVSPAGGMFTRLLTGDRSISTGEVRALDLTGCGRVELWTCPIHDLMDAFDTTMPYRGPTNVGSCFQLAGARVLLGCPWKVSELAAGLLAVAFMNEAPPPGSATADARALARAIRRYREVVRSGGPMERAVVESLADQPNATASEVARAFQIGWQVAARHLSGEAFPAVTSDTPASPELKVLTLMAPLRVHSAWAGWRVVARDRHCLGV